MDERFRSEEIFHDEKFGKDDHTPIHYEYNPTSFVYEKMIEKIGNIENLQVLEYGCGTGWFTIELASKGAFIHAFDISGEAVRQTQTLISQFKFDKKNIISKMPAEKLDYEDDKFDLICGFAIIHHLDLDLAIPELFRVLKKRWKSNFR